MNPAARIANPAVGKGSVLLHLVRMFRARSLLLREQSQSLQNLIRLDGGKISVVQLQNTGN